ncbi:hypothetical protein N8083_00435 [Candidatus Pacebacteria bacterium]|nr:hypothetical protein [Candidatus Paceibacterota bacterium]
MASKKRGFKKKREAQKSFWCFFGVYFVLFLSVCGTGFGIYHLVSAYVSSNEPVPMVIDPNIGIRAIVEEFFNANDASEMISIIKCESEFKHYGPDEEVLKNRAGSSAIGVAQILSSVHPDPKVLSLYNKRFNTDVTEETFDITTLEGNLGYALMLYELRGTRDWECSKKFRFVR